MPISPKPVLVVGSINIDLVVNAEKVPVAGETVRGSEFQLHPGGKGANQAVAVGRLGYPVQLIGKVGRDTFGAELRTYLHRAGVDIAAVEVSAESSGVAMIAVSPNGSNSIIVVPGANAQVTPEFLDTHLDMIRGAGIVLTQLEIPLDTVEHLADLCGREGLPLILDPAPAQTLPHGIFRHVHWFTPNETETAFFAATSGKNGKDQSEPKQIVDSLLALGIHGVVLKMGSQGAYLASSDGIAQFVSAYPVKVVDTTAAGDAFNGAFATGLMLGMDAAKAARFASAAAAISVTRPGAQPSMPSRSEVEQLLEAHR
jgi:ribokinase